MPREACGCRGRTLFFHHDRPRFPLERPARLTGDGVLFLAQYTASIGEVFPDWVKVLKIEGRGWPLPANVFAILGGPAFPR
jgi:hypothetical protein